MKVSAVFANLSWHRRVCTLALLSISIGVQAQCLIVEKGQKIQLVSKSYANPLPLTEKKWEKMNTEQRDELIDKLNISIQKGEVKPWMNLTSNFEITEVNNSSPISSFTLKATDGTYVYETTNYCASDTMHLVRNANLVYSVLKGDTLGFAIQGVARIPNKLKVGDKIPSYNDYAITFPETWTKTIKESVKAFSYTTTDNKVGYYQDSESGAFSHGEFKVTERHDVYQTISHKLKISENIENLTINYFVANVTAQEKITVGGKAYDAFVIESESWSKGGIVRDYDAENETIAREQQAKFDALLNKQMEWTTKSGYTNELGYKVSYKKEWFVPGYGPVKIEVHDQFGAIQTYMDIIL
ncbi:MAG: hypothetical protein HC811_06195 [Flammeovirgaceae bacterium]|nr:hypothetical protein [Flammeovirgaceae bacterium]